MRLLLGADGGRLIETERGISDDRRLLVDWAFVHHQRDSAPA